MSNWVRYLEAIAQHHIVTNDGSKGPSFKNGGRGKVINCVNMQHTNYGNTEKIFSLI